MLFWLLLLPRFPIHTLCAMADNNSEMLALMAELMRSADRDREENMRRFEDIGRNFERLTQVMIDGFGRLEDKIIAVKDEVAGVKQEVAGVKQEVASVKQEVVGLNQRVDTLTDEQRAMNRRLQATFDQTGKLTEQAAATELRLTRTEQAAPTNAELDARLREVENRLRNAS